jgi:hypothetical protein
VWARLGYLVVFADDSGAVTSPALHPCSPSTWGSGVWHLVMLKASDLSLVPER